MDNNWNNSSDSFDNSPLIGNYIEPDPALVYIFNDQPNAMPQQRNAQQNDPFVVEQDHVSFTDLTIQDVSTHSDNGLTIGGVSKLDQGDWLMRKRKFPFMDSMIEDHPMHDKDNFSNGKNMSAHINLNELRFWPPETFDIDIDTSFDPFLHNLIDRNISIFDLSNDELISPSSQQNALPQHEHEVLQNAVSKQQNALPQLLHTLSQSQNVYQFGVEQIHVPILKSTFQDQSLHVNYNFTTGGEVPNIDVEYPSRKGKQSMAEHPLLRHGILNEEDVIAIDHWAPSSKLLSCSCCQILRQIIHTDGFKFEKLEIHGSLGVIGHAIFHIQDMTPGGEPPREIYQMIDLCRKSIEQIRSFLVAYCKDQTRLGLVTLDDPLSAYYDTICTGLDWAEHYNDGDDDLNPPNGTEPESDSEPEPETVPEPEPDPVPEPHNGEASTTKPKPKRNMAVQRKRVPKMTMNDLSPFFHLTIRDAADKLDVSDSVVKKISRLGNLKRWPQRKLQSLAKDVRVLRKALNSPYEETRKRVQQEIQRLQREMVAICGGVVPTGIEMVQLEEE